MYYCFFYVAAALSFFCGSQINSLHVCVLKSLLSGQKNLLFLYNYQEPSVLLVNKSRKRHLQRAFNRIVLQRPLIKCLCYTTYISTRTNAIVVEIINTFVWSRAVTFMEETFNETIYCVFFFISLSGWWS